MSSFAITVVLLASLEPVRTRDRTGGWQPYARGFQIGSHGMHSYAVAVSVIGVSSPGRSTYVVLTTLCNVERIPWGRLGAIRS